MTLNLLEPSFIERDPQVITDEIVAQYEFLTGKTLYPAQVERIFIDIMAIRETLVRVGIQEAAKQNLLAYARAPILDYLAEFFQVFRLPAEPATVILEFSITAPQATDLVIPVGTRADLGSANSLAFATLSELIIVAGQTNISGTAECTTAGTVGNGIATNKLISLVDGVGLLDVSVTNITLSSDGFDEESDEQLRERVRLAPEAFSTAGCRGAYEFYARSASPAIIDVAIVRGYYGQILIYPLTTTGLPSQPLLDQIETICSAEDVRPISDEVHALAPDVVEYQLNVRVYPRYSTDSNEVLTNSQDSLTQYANNNALALACDIVPSQIDALLSNNKVWRVEVIEPIAPLILAEHQLAICTDIICTLGEARYE